MFKHQYGDAVQPFSYFEYVKKIAIKYHNQYAIFTAWNF